MSDKGDKINHTLISELDSLRRKVEELEGRLVRAEDLYRAVFEQAGDGSFLFDTEGRPVAVNEMFARMHGYSVKETKRLGIEGLEVNSGASLPERLGRVLNGETLNFEVEHRHRDGHVFPLGVTVTMITVGDEKLVLATHRDLTEERGARQALEKSEYRHRQIAAMSADYIFEVSVNEKGEPRLEWTSLNLTSITGRSVEESATINQWKNIFHPDDFPRVMAFLRQVMESGKEGEIEGRTFLKSGQQRWVQIKARPIADESTGKIIKILGSVSDISERKRMEDERVKMERLESLGLLAGGIAHDFNNILTGVTGHISLARSKLKAGRDAAKFLGLAEKATDRARELTRQLLTFARGGAPVTNPASIVDLIRESVEFAQHGSKVKITVRLADDLHTAKVDPGQISQALNNIVLNAIQAMPEGGEIEITAENIILSSGNHLSIAPGDYIKVAIADQGPGMEPEVLARLFEPYFTTKEKGTGLGLAGAYSIAARHGGRLTAASNPGKGSVFTLYLPATLEKPDNEHQAGESGHHGSGRILVIDDDEQILEVTSDMLDELGYQVQTARDGDEAIKKYRESLLAGTPFNVVIMDLTVPGGMGGREAVAELLRIDPRVKAVVFTGYSEDAVLANYRDYGFCAGLAKPFKLDDLKKILVSIMS